MDPNSVPVTPTWVRKRDGRLVPFDADRICRDLFAAAQSIGRTDAFVARELTDASLHFIAADCGGTTPTTERVRDIVAQMLRELKQMKLANAFETGATTATDAEREGLVVRLTPSLAPEDIPDACLRAYSLSSVFTPELTAAHREDLIRIEGLTHPNEMHAVAVGPVRRFDELLPAVEAASRLAGRTLALEGIETIESCERLAGTIASAARLTGRTIVVNLNGSPPPWADEAADGPLFDTDRSDGNRHVAEQACDRLADRLCDRSSSGLVQVAWHLSERDFSSQRLARLTPLCRAALSGVSPTFVFDRPRRSPALAEGMERGSSVLLAVGLNLGRLASHGLNDTQERTRRQDWFLDRLRSLTRLALSAGLRKRERLRKLSAERPALARGFLLERARLLAIPFGLGDALERLLDKPIDAEESAQLGTTILTRLREVLRDEGRSASLETCLDDLPDETKPDSLEVPMKERLKALSRLHGSAGGSGTVVLPGGTSADDIASRLRWAWNRSGLTRLRFVPPPYPLKQMTFETAAAAESASH